MVVANYIGFLASARAMRRWIVHRVTGEPITWDKTMHAYPSLEEIRRAQASFAWHDDRPAGGRLPETITASLAGPEPAAASERPAFRIDQAIEALQARPRRAAPTPPPMPAPLERIRETTP